MERIYVLCPLYSEECWDPLWTHSNAKASSVDHFLFQLKAGAVVLALWSFSWLSCAALILRLDFSSVVLLLFILFSFRLPFSSITRPNLPTLASSQGTFHDPIFGRLQQYLLSSYNNEEKIVLEKIGVSMICCSKLVSWLLLWLQCWNSTCKISFFFLLLKIWEPLHSVKMDGRWCCIGMPQMID